MAYPLTPAGTDGLRSSTMVTAESMVGLELAQKPDLPGQSSEDLDLAADG